MITTRYSLSGKIIIISAPSGAGKSSIIKRVVSGKHKYNIRFLVSYTTRLPRSGEVDGLDYFFVTKNIFKKMIKDKVFIEWAMVHNNYYGTSKILLDNILRAQKKVILEIDVQGAMQIKKFYPDACMIFVMPPNLNNLYERLMFRQQDSCEIINERMQTAKQELKCINNYDYLVINKNNKLNDAVHAVETIIESLNYKIINRKFCFDRFYVYNTRNNL
ncbi:MAG: guanylate kinase [Endomicrobium sp.]|jgi:guanylate kinase|nr:guanylate kinase [Endomicrobium sp.]